MFDNSFDERERIAEAVRHGCPGTTLKEKFPVIFPFPIRRPSGARPTRPKGDSTPPLHFRFEVFSKYPVYGIGMNASLKGA